MWTWFWVCYEEYNQYFINKLLRHVIYMKQDLIINESFIKPAKLPAPQNSLNKATYAKFWFFKIFLLIILVFDKTKIIKHALDAKTLELISYQPNFEDANIIGNLSNIFYVSNKDIAVIAYFWTITIIVILAGQKFVCLKTQLTLGY